MQQIFWDVYKNGFIVEDSITQLYCQTVCNRFLADRYVHGTCPNCAYDDARGDQCDNCGRMLNPSELLHPKCSTCDNPPITKQTTHLFLDLPKLQTKLSEWVDHSSNAGNWTSNALSMTQTWLRDGLKQRCITRDLKWGVPVPLEGFTDKVFYVWFDAPIGYPSITAALCGDKWKEWWQPTCDVKLVQFMGKDNVPFHTIVFPSSLLATGEKWVMLSDISTSEYLNYEAGKFSKSRGVGVFGNDAIDTGIPSEVWRYYLLINRPEGSDSMFTWNDLAVKNNDELINTLGNYINRTVTFLHKFFDRRIPELDVDDPTNEQFTTNINKELKEYIGLMEKISIKAGLKKAMAIASIGNLYLQTKAPWKLFKEGNKAAAGSSLTYSANLVILVALLLEPFLGPKFSRKVFSQLGMEHTPGVNNIIPDIFNPQQWLTAGMETSKPVILFTTITPKQIEEFRKKYNGKQNTRVEEDNEEPGFALDLRVGKVVEIGDHEEADKLFVAKVDVGEESGPRTVVAGLRDVYTAEQLLNSKVVMVCNLAPAQLVGIDSQGMILVAEKKKVTKTLCVDDSLEIGERLVTEGFPLKVARKPLDRKGFQAASKPLRVAKDGTIVFDKKYRLVAESNSSYGVSGAGVPEGGKVK